jgi:hypothetical protein
MPRGRCKTAGSFRVCRSYDPGNESHVLTAIRPGGMIVEGEAWKFHFFGDRRARDSWYKDIRGENDVRELLLNSCRQGEYDCHLGIEREDLA